MRAIDRVQRASGVLERAHEQNGKDADSGYPRGDFDEQWFFHESDSLPIRSLVVLQELSPDVRPRVETADDRIDDSGAAIDAVERRAEPVLRLFTRGDFHRIFV